MLKLGASKFSQYIVGATFLVASVVASAETSISINGIGSNRYPVAVAHFATEGSANPPEDVSAIIRADLDRSAMFATSDVGNIQWVSSGRLNLDAWKSNQLSGFVMGVVSPLVNGQWYVKFRLVDPISGNDLATKSFSVRSDGLRAVSHQIADVIYKQLTGLNGFFSSRIAYVSKSSGVYELRIADADGANPHVALHSTNPIMSPTWSRDGSHLAYVTFENGPAQVYVHDLATASRRVVAKFRGSNSAPSFSPDGRTLVVTLTKDGNSELYQIPIEGGDPKRLTHNSVIDTEGVYSHDGRSIIFTSDRSGRPQIYKMDASGGGDAQRLTFRTDYAVAPHLSPDGHTITYIARNSGALQVQVLDSANGESHTLTSTRDDESPSFCPNGTLILYATKVSGKSVLMVTTPDGSFKQPLQVTGDVVRAPVWGPN